MKGIVLAAGIGTRLLPFTRIINKTLLPVYAKPMIYYPIETLINSGIKEIIIVVNPLYKNQVENVVNNLKFSQKISLTFTMQRHTLGMVDAIKRCQKYIAGGSMIVITGDNFFENIFTEEIDNFSKGAVSFLRKVKDPQNYGVPIFQHQKLIKIEEKPKHPSTNLVVTGPHLFDNQVFKMIQQLRPSPRGELEITDLNNLYLKAGQLKLIKKAGYWKDMGTFDSLMEVSQYRFKNQQ